ncbi:hypothetical protein C8A00DRAFT_40715 [Chaetomidium leptoderma]|uniref:C3H1-type domain-containing protein n=1 Tax=Chaetomidium leptoderma TaxID=669021 RepID=A0AAN6VT91_9PEZI|nr:hypothetical protein C8A00DRAFT_40715 [Chaetomidium leptoderma]
MASGPRFFIVRPDTKRSTADGRVHTLPGPIVPLVAVDELPEWLDIVGVPRELSVEQTIGLCNLGTASKGKGAYAVRAIRQQSAAMKNAEAKQENNASAITPQPSPHLTAPTSSLETKALTPAPPTPAAIHAADRMRAHWSEPHARALGISSSSIHNPQQAQPHQPQGQQEQQQPSLPAHAHTTTTTTPSGSSGSSNSNSNGPSPSTEYCRHWCYHGTCKWGFRCRYLHAMPTTPRELAEVGLREIPAWWIASAAVGLATTGHHHHQYHLQHQRNNNNNNNHNNIAAGLGLMGGGAGRFDPRDVRLVGLPGGGGGSGVVPNPDGGGGSSVNSNSNRNSNSNSNNSKRMMKAQLRETVALLRELGLRVGNHGNGNGNGRARKREVNPLEKGRGKGFDKEAVLSAARADMASTAAASGQVQTGLVVAAAAAADAAGGMLAEAKQDGGGKQEGGRAASIGAQVIAAPTAGKLVDV